MAGKKKAENKVDKRDDTLDLEHIAKIEGHAKLHIKIRKGEIKKVELKVFEGARYFEGILKGRKFNDLSHISSRICGVCSVVHTITALKAVEDAFGVTVSEQTKKLREVLNIGGIIQSHVLHLYFLALPDYRGVGGALELAKTDKKSIEVALRLKRLGNNIVNTIAGRDVHPIACVLGGFSRIPDQKRVGLLLEELKTSRKDARKCVEMFLDLDYGKFNVPTPMFALTGGTYFYSDSLVRCEGDVCFKTKDYGSHFKEYLREGSTAEFATQEGKSYVVGALARVCNNNSLLSTASKKYSKHLCENSTNPFMNVPAQAIEVLEGIEKAIEILSTMTLRPEEPVEMKVKPCACEGVGACEAPRGILFHRYKFDSKGYCTFADITTPTTQSLQHLEDAIKAYLPGLLGRSPEEIKIEVAKLVRAYDPCISCSTHSLKIDLELD